MYQEILSRWGSVTAPRDNSAERSPANSALSSAPCIARAVTPPISPRCGSTPTHTADVSRAIRQGHPRTGPQDPPVLQRAARSRDRAVDLHQRPGRASHQQRLRASAQTRRSLATDKLWHPNRHRQPDRRATPHPPRNLPPTRPPPPRIPHRRGHRPPPRQRDPACPRRPDVAAPPERLRSWLLS